MGCPFYALLGNRSWRENSGDTYEIHPPSPETTGMPVEEGERSSAASADSACASCRADEPGEAQRESNWAKTGHNKGTTRMRVGLHWLH